jgi:hypothetical protein
VVEEPKKEVHWWDDCGDKAENKEEAENKSPK